MRWETLTACLLNPSLNTPESWIIMMSHSWTTMSFVAEISLGCTWELVAGGKWLREPTFEMSVYRNLQFIVHYCLSCLQTETKASWSIIFKRKKKTWLFDTVILNLTIHIFQAQATMGMVILYQLASSVVIPSWGTVCFESLSVHQLTAIELLRLKWYFSGCTSKSTREVQEKECLLVGICLLNTLGALGYCKEHNV